MVAIGLIGKLGKGIQEKRNSGLSSFGVVDGGRIVFY
jgi:hypothetical protein